MGKLNKAEMDHIRHRVESIVKCTNGEIATSLNRIKKGTGLTPTRMFGFIKSGDAKVLSEHKLVKIERYRHSNAFEALLDCFEYPNTVTQAEKIAFNKRVERKSEELMQEVALEGKRLIDNIVLGIIETTEVPNELHKLGSMSSLGRAFSPSDFSTK